jgi:hypothetical protein
MIVLLELEQDDANAIKNASQIMYITKKPKHQVVKRIKVSLLIHYPTLCSSHANPPAQYEKSSPPIPETRTIRVTSAHANLQFCSRDGRADLLQRISLRTYFTL